MSKPICYISGPMTGVEDFNRLAFFEAAEKLAEFYVVLNPAILPYGLNYDDYMRIDLAMVSVSTVLVLLPGWKNSKGAKMELGEFLSQGKRNVFEMTLGELVSYFASSSI